MCKTCYEILNLNGKMCEGVQLNYVQCNKYDLKGEVYNKDYHHCICGKSIVNKFLIKDKISEIVYIIGSSCIQMLFPENKELIEAVTYNLCRKCNTTVKNMKAHCKSNKHKKNVKYTYCATCPDGTVRRKSNNKKCNKCIRLKRNAKYIHCVICSEQTVRIKSNNKKCNICIRFRKK